MFNKILVAVDNSPISDKVFNKAVSFAKQLNANLMLFHVLDPFEENYLTSNGVYLNSDYPTFSENNIDYYLGAWKGLEQEGIEYLQLLRNQANASSVSAEFTQDLGDPGRKICEFASNWNADLIILGRRGRKGISELLLGSVSNYVVHHAPCSVLTVQEKNIANKEESKQSQLVENVST